jgi:hypothetical protein
MPTIIFDGSSKLKRIGEREFSFCGLTSTIIPASTETIEGSTGVGCPFAL